MLKQSELIQYFIFLKFLIIIYIMGEGRSTPPPPTKREFLANFLLPFYGRALVSWHQLDHHGVVDDFRRQVSNCYDYI